MRDLKAIYKAAKEASDAWSETTDCEGDQRFIDAMCALCDALEPPPKGAVDHGSN